MYYFIHDGAMCNLAPIDPNYFTTMVPADLDHDTVTDLVTSSLADLLRLAYQEKNTLNNRVIAMCEGGRTIYSVRATTWKGRPICLEKGCDDDGQIRLNYDDVSGCFDDGKMGASLPHQLRQCYSHVKQFADIDDIAQMAADIGLPNLPNLDSFLDMDEIRFLVMLAEIELAIELCFGESSELKSYNDRIESTRFLLHDDS